MAREIELKIRLHDPEALMARLAGSEELGTYLKDDTYYRGPAGVFRVRRSGGEAVVCRKQKTVSAGVEVSRETEFTVGDFDAFADFAASLGCREWYRKRKSGRAWRFSGILIEVGTVSDLGWFAELEILLGDEASSAEVEEAKRRLFSALGTLGLDKEALEARSYAELLGHKDG